jgi:ferredoxin
MKAEGRSRTDYLIIAEPVNPAGGGQRGSTQSLNAPDHSNAPDQPQRLAIGARPDMMGLSCWDYILATFLELDMPKLTVEEVGTFEAPAGKRLVLALIDEAGIDQLHACGGNARCTTCRVEFAAGEPAKMTEAEKNVLAARGLADAGIRLSCQIVCDHDMTVRAKSRLAGSGRADAGKRPADEIQPQPVVWTEKSG